MLADKGVCCIDEFGAIKAGDRAAIHEAMEQQTLSVAKAGLVCTLAARCAVMACANPKGGVFDSRADLSVNTSLPPSLLSRFDVILVVVDAPDASWDRAVSAQILNSSIRPGCGSLDPLDDGDERPAKRKRVAPRPKAWSLDRLRRYVAYVREQFKPTLGDDAARVVEAYYARQRRRRGGGLGTGDDPHARAVLSDWPRPTRGSAAGPSATRRTPSSRACWWTSPWRRTRSSRRRRTPSPS